MKKLVVTRMFALVPVLLAVSLIAFLLLELAPGDVVLAILGSEATPERILELRKELGLDASMAVRYGRWLRNSLHGDLGFAPSLGMRVSDAIAQRIRPTLALAVCGLTVAVALGIPAGVVAAVFRNGRVDQLVMAVSVFGVSLPSFVTGLLLMLLFSLRLGVLPSGGYVPMHESFTGWLSHLALPSFSVGLYHAALIARMTRSSVAGILSQDFVRTARAKGLGEMVVIMKHSLKNALPPVLTVIGTSFGGLLGGIVVTETIFAYPGVGRLAVLAIERRDPVLLQGVILVSASVYVLVNLLVDIGYAVVDPRVRFD